MERIGGLINYYFETQLELLILYSIVLLKTLFKKEIMRKYSMIKFNIISLQE